MNNLKNKLISLILLFTFFAAMGGGFFLQTQRPGFAHRFYKRYIESLLIPKDKQEVNIMDIPVIAQTKNLNCEATTAQMILHYFGKNIPVDDIQAALPLNANPHKGFRGNVDGPVWGLDDYGVYAEPIADVMTKFGVKAKAYTNISTEDLKKSILAGKPAIIWINIANPHPEVKEEIIDGEKVKLISGEHVAVVTGYKNGTWILNDPWRKTVDGKPVAEQIEVENLDAIMWKDFDHMAVIVE